MFNWKKYFKNIKYKYCKKVKCLLPKETKHRIGAYTLYVKSNLVNGKWNIMYDINEHNESVCSKLLVYSYFNSYAHMEHHLAIEYDIVLGDICE